MKRVVVLLAATLPPAALILLATVRLYGARFRMSSLFADAGGVLTILAIACGLYCLALLIHVSQLKERLARSAGERKKILQVGDYYAEKTASMQSDMEVLSAVRNLTSILSDEVQIDAILSQVTQVVQEVTECREVTVFLLEERTGAPVARAHRTASGCLVGEELDKAGIDSVLVSDAIAHRTVMRSLGSDDRVTLAVPLSDDVELLGALRLVSALSGGAGEKSERIERIESHTLALAKHVTVAIKTPILYNRAVVDGLTGLYTRRHFSRQIETQFSASLRLQRPMALILLDIDDFKSLNDNHGHLFGDRILTAVGQLIPGSLRGYDTAYRYGGEEICVILPEAEAEAAFKVAERIRNKLARRVFRTDDKTRVRVTVSGGVAQYEKGLKTYQELIQRSDEALYAAKAAGKNRTCVWEKSIHDNLPGDTRRGTKPEAPSKTRKP